MSWYVFESIPVLPIERFAEKHGLTMLVRERPYPEGHPSRYYARFDKCDTKGDGVIIGEYGDGPTPDEAIAEFAQKISNKTLVWDAFSESRKDIRVPRLTHTAPLVRRP